MTVGLRAADNQLAAQEFLVVQLRDSPFRFLDRLHLDERKTFRTFVMLVGHHFRVLHLTNSVEKLEQVALRRVEGQIADVKTR